MMCFLGGEKERASEITKFLFMVFRHFISQSHPHNSIVSFRLLNTATLWLSLSTVLFFIFLYLPLNAYQPWWKTDPLMTDSFLLTSRDLDTFSFLNIKIECIKRWNRLNYYNKIYLFVEREGLEHAVKHRMDKCVIQDLKPFY